MIVRSAFQLQYWISAWKIERQRIQLARKYPVNLTSSGQPIPSSVNLIPILTESINLLENDQINIKEISLCSLMRQGRYLVLNFGSCT